MIKKATKQQFVDIFSIPFQNEDPLNAQLDNTGTILVSLQPKFPLHYVV